MVALDSVWYNFDRGFDRAPGSDEGRIAGVWLIRQALNLDHSAPSFRDVVGRRFNGLLVRWRFAIKIEKHHTIHYGN
jgi:hypothetical protein